MNKIILIGNLTRDPEKGSGNGVDFVKFTLAVNSGKDKTDYFNCVAFRATATVVGDKLSKGDRVGIVGAGHFKEYETRDGAKRKDFEIVVSEVEFLNIKKNTAQNGSDGLKTETGDNGLEPVSANDDDLPF